MAGVTTLNLPQSNLADDVIVNWQGSTRLIPIARLVALLMAEVGPAHETRVQLFADLDWATGSAGRVYGDGNSNFNGIYRKNGVFGGGNWTRIGDLPTRLERSARIRHRAKRCKKPTTPWAKDRNDPDRENQIATASNRARDTDVDPLR
ncbi:hypothetical protein SAMN04489859_10747 [Paracoccus alcaliphilus]|uniref:Uncharacterized protein n=1 Tax=Paracoccus alcaliphilus TaxID=34002 RepID=A0A1H8NZ52_9RHOB|nr:hypothetical protein [Paracoccus alcaliphilus]WCR20901.1 hypothetical protein JHW40_23250 [Paracoccus alcaliphilus]SEO34791.1 hypothetical protein SAMN04489859_10747 [Paracoccus alcaliphilus]